ncbi:MAG: phenylalanine--tRNA ligase subunit alpha, partial [Verrucomicrobiota bacterium]|nr:phenylalanine--tRNA ligase subunit alpha [Verrucomicrobiota bacterium]
MHPLEELRDSALADVAAATDESALDAVRVRYLGRSGSIAAWGEQMKSLSKEEKPVVGKLLNQVRSAVTSALGEAGEKLRAAKESGALAATDISLPGTPDDIGAL